MKDSSVEEPQLVLRGKRGSIPHVFGVNHGGHVHHHGGFIRDELIRKGLLRPGTAGDGKCDELVRAGLVTNGIFMHRGTLVVVDMQPGFSTASRNWYTLACVERLILCAVSEGRAIVVLENEPWRHGRTYWRLLRHLVGYEHVAIEEKTVDDGSAQVIRACEELGFDVDDFEVCGVHTDACVKDTVRGIARRWANANVKVFREGCYSNTPVGMWYDFSRDSNVEIVSIKDYRSVSCV